MLIEVYRRLIDVFGPQGWWPAESRLEVIVGAMLTQHTSWKNVERAIENLRHADLLNLARLVQIDHAELASLIRPAGYFRLKAKRLQNLMRFISDHYDGSLDTMFAVDTQKLREQLLHVNGVGPETADSILLYAGDHPTFVIDNYTLRIMRRHGWCQPQAEYHALKEVFETALPKDRTIFNEFHALIVVVGKEFCGPTPRCDDCPLREMLPAGGPLELR